jgi:hypothetical protein
MPEILDMAASTCFPLFASANKSLDDCYEFV